MPTDEKPCSVQIGFFGLKATAQVANALAKLVKQPNGAQNRTNKFAAFNVNRNKSIY
jgi:hypothetical protein